MTHWIRRPLSPRRVIVLVAVGAFAITAVLGIAALLVPGTFSETQGKIILTTLVVGAVCLLTLAFMATADAQHVAVGVLGGAVTLIGLVSSLVLIWNPWQAWRGDGWVRTFGVAATLAPSLAVIGLLLSISTLYRVRRSLLWPTIAAIAAFAIVLSSTIILATGSGGVARLIGVLGILGALGTVILVTTALAGGRRQRLSAPSSAPVSTPDDVVHLSSSTIAALSEAAKRRDMTTDQLAEDVIAAYLRDGPPS